MRTFRLYSLTLAILFVILLRLLSACVGLPTLAVTPTTVLSSTPEATTTPATTLTTPSPAPFVTVVGTVNVRDDSGRVVGWLEGGDRVRAVCDGQWCVLPGDDGLMFWRGCSDNNPDGLGCEVAR
jgi:hypothetical protein